MHFVIDNRNSIAARLHAGVVGPGAIRQAETPVMPGAGHDAIFYMAAGKRGTSMWAAIVNGVVLTIGQEYSHIFVANRHDAIAASRQL